MQLSEMKLEDLESVTKLGAQLGYPYSLSEIRERFAEVSVSSVHKLFVAKESGIVCGWVQVCKERETLLSDARAEITALVVDESVRGKGIGRALVNAAEDWALSQGLKLMRLRTNVQREDAHQFYRRVGYVESKRSCLFLREL